MKYFLIILAVIIGFIGGCIEAVITVFVVLCTVIFFVTAKTVEVIFGSRR